ncbi:MAG: hypothetical protein KKF50_00760 [Nanoarchaeota archaeon]|nr:hypothetical protein [Nanoarchaeota archaeon]
METKIIKQEKNPFLEREEIVMEISSETAPSFEDVKTVLGKDANLTVVKRIDGNFGKQTFTAEIFVYDNEEAKSKIETIPKKIRKKMAEESKAVADAAKKAEATEKATKEAAETKAKVEETLVEEPVAEEPSKGDSGEPKTE